MREWSARVRSPREGFRAARPPAPFYALPFCHCRKFSRTRICISIIQRTSKQSTRCSFRCKSPFLCFFSKPMMGEGGSYAQGMKRSVCSCHEARNTRGSIARTRYTAQVFFSFFPFCIWFENLIYRLSTSRNDDRTCLVCIWTGRLTSFDGDAFNATARGEEKLDRL